MVGDAGDVNFWFRQGTLTTCGPSVMAQILNDFTGTAYTDEMGLAAEAQAAGLFNPASGMRADQIETFLDTHGVPSTVVENQGFDDVERYLREGRAVVMFVDAKDVIGPGYEAFAASDEPENTPLDTVDHFVRVIGIDRAAGVAIISNPGQDGGSQVEIPLDRLEEAWNDNIYKDGVQGPNSHVLIVSDGSDPSVDAGLQPMGQQSTQPQPQLPPQSGATPGPTPTGPEPEPEPGPVTLPSRPGPGSEPPEPTSTIVPPAPSAPRSVELPAPVAGIPATAPSAAGPVELPAAESAGSAEPAAAGAPSSGADADGDGWIDPIHGLVIIPVALAGARIAMAAKERLAD
jgi:hypothetical protein